MQNSPRVSSGPDIHEFILGHEGNFGIVTECIIKLRPVPQVQIYDSIIFHEFDLGIKFMYEGKSKYNTVCQSKAWPANLRLIDNKQFAFGMALKTEKSKFQEMMNRAKKYFIT